jgi:capsid protein
MLIPMLVRPIAERFHAQGVLLGLWPPEMPDGVSHVPPAHEMIDPLKDTSALIAQVRAGFVPQPEAVGSFGYDFRQASRISARPTQHRCRRHRARPIHAASPSPGAAKTRRKSPPSR